MREKNIIKIASIYVGAILGAGFASGREITEYFVCYGYKGIYGLILSGILFATIGSAVMYMAYKNNIKNYKDFINMTFGNVFGNIIEWVSIIFMFILFSTMMSACGAIMKQNGGFSSQWAILILALICGVTFMFGLKGVIIINSIASPILFVGGICLGLYAFFEKVLPVSTNILESNYNWIVSAIIYVSYNIITAISVLTSMPELLDSKKTAIYGAIIGGLTLGIMGICLGLGIMANYNDIHMLQLPVLEMAIKYGVVIKNFYIFMLIIAIYTTAVINGYSVITWAVKRFKIKKILFIVLFILAGVIAGQLEFSKFVGVIYPLFGYIGIFQVIVILISFLFSKH